MDCFSAHCPSHTNKPWLARLGTLNFGQIEFFPSKTGLLERTPAAAAAAVAVAAAPACHSTCRLFRRIFTVTWSKTTTATTTRSHPHPHSPRALPEPCCAAYNQYLYIVESSQLAHTTHSPCYFNPVRPFDCSFLIFRVKPTHYQYPHGKTKRKKKQ